MLVSHRVVGTADTDDKFAVPIALSELIPVLDLDIDLLAHGDSAFLIPAANPSSNLPTGLTASIPPS